MLGEHQKINAALALATVEILQKQIPVKDEAIRAGLASVDWPGRLQLFTRESGQQILLDGAHNVAGGKALREALEKSFPAPKRTLVLGVFQRAAANMLGIGRVAEATKLRGLYP